MSKIKAHWEEHKEKYYIGTIAGLSLLSATSLYLQFKTQGVALSNPTINNNNALSWKPTNTNVIFTELERRGHPGNKILCNQTGEVFASQNRASSANGLSPLDLSKHLRGLMDDVNGLTFENLGEMS